MALVALLNTLRMVSVLFSKSFNSHNPVKFIPIDIYSIHLFGRTLKQFSRFDRACLLHSSIPDLIVHVKLSCLLSFLGSSGEVAVFKVVHITLSFNYS